MVFISAAQGRTLLIKPVHAFDELLTGGLGDAQPARCDVVTQKVEAPLYGADERLVGMLAVFDFGRPGQSASIANLAPNRIN